MKTPTRERQSSDTSVGSVISNIVFVGLKGLVRCYQIVVSPFVQPRCRFQPSCSRYAMEALETHGWLSGSVLALKRLARCHPWTVGGVDLVPKPKTDGSID